MATLSGIIRALKTVAKLETTKGTFVLDPYPQDAPLPPKSRQEMGLYLFGYLDGRELKVSGIEADDTLFNARLRVSSKAAMQDVDIAPESTDPLAREIEQYFQKESREVAIKLNDVGIRSIAAFYHRLNNYDREVEVFSKYLRVPENRIRDFLEKLRSDSTTRALVQASPRFPVTRGVDLRLLSKAKGRHVTKFRTPAPLNPPKFPDSAVTPNLPSTVSLAKFSTNIKNQGLRGTCVAHSALACLEAEFIRLRGLKRNLDLSEQYLYWACKQVDGAVDEEGTLLRYAADVLFRGVPAQSLPGGVCKEANWKYNRFPIQGNESQAPLPQRAGKAVGEKKYRTVSTRRLRHRSIASLKEALQKGQCVALSVLTYHFWEDDYTWRSGVISLPLGIEPNGAHAICLIGYNDDDATHRDGYFTFKNHWGEEWGHTRTDKGYGSLPYRYVLREAIEAYAFEAESMDAG
jgi:C1A family cysteine protease